MPPENERRPQHARAAGSWAGGPDGHSKDTPSLFDYLAATTGADRRDRGMQAAEHAANTAFRLYVLAQLSELVASGREFTAEDLRARTGDPLDCSPNVFGAAIAGAARRGEIAPAGYRQAERPEAHCRVLRVWKAA